MNKFETMKRQKDGLDVLADIPGFAESGFELIPEDDLDRLKWAGIFHRKPTRPHFMMRIRFPSGIASSDQIRTVADVLDHYGRGIADLTTRQQIEPRWLCIEDMPTILTMLESAGLTTLQTGMDNIRGVIGCALAGIYPRELLDASSLCREFQDAFVGDRAFTNLPRKFNVAITGCPDNCTLNESQDVALVPAIKDTTSDPQRGFNVLVGGKMGSGGFTVAQSLDIFVLPAEAARLCAESALIFRDFGPRETRSQARLAFLLEERGTDWLRATLEERLGHRLATAGTDLRQERIADHIGLTAQRQAGLSAVGLLVPLGRATSQQLREAARLADRFGQGEVRLTAGQNLVLPHIPWEHLPALLAEPLLTVWRPDPAPLMRGLVACTGTEFCNLALIETKARARAVEEALTARIPDADPIRIYWSGCPAGCGNHQAADIGLQGKRIRVNGEVIEAVAIYAGGRAGPGARPGRLLMDDVPCDGRLPDVLEELVRSARKSPSPPEASMRTRTLSEPVS